MSDEDKLKWLAANEEACARARNVGPTTPHETAALRWLESQDLERGQWRFDIPADAYKSLAVLLDSAEQAGFERCRNLLRELIRASHAVAVLQPAAHAKDQAAADRWAKFYSAIGAFADAYGKAELPRVAPADVPAYSQNELDVVVAKAVADEREACAKVCDDVGATDPPYSEGNNGAVEAALRIRARLTEGR